MCTCHIRKMQNLQIWYVYILNNGRQNIFISFLLCVWLAQLSPRLIDLFFNRKVFYIPKKLSIKNVKIVIIFFILFLSLSSLLWRPTQLYLKGRGRGEGRGEREEKQKKTTRFFNTFIPVYIHIHIQNETSKSNISKTVRDREKVSMEVR